MDSFGSWAIAIVTAVFIVALSVLLAVAMDWML
jgi:hypothetical protein